MKKLLFISGLVISGLVISAFADAQENCGFPVSLLRSGFETGEQAQYVTLPGDTTPLTMTVDYPTQNLTVGLPALQVYGTLSGPSNLGVRINDAELAINSATDFTSQLFALLPGSNAIQIKIETQAGAIQTVTRDVIYDPQLVTEVSFQAKTSGDYAPITIPFALKTVNPPAQTQVTKVQIDFDGDGIFEVDAATAPTKIEGRYQNPGVYLARARIEFDDGNMATPVVVRESRYRIQMKSLAYVRQTLCGVYYGLKNKLVANQVTDAVAAMSPRIRADYEILFNFQGAALPARAAKLGVVVSGLISDISAEFTVAIPDAGTPGEFSGFPVQFARDTKGVWRISAL